MMNDTVSTQPNRRCLQGPGPRLGVAGTLVLLAACGPKIQRFDVTPLRLCAGESVSVAYDVRGVPRLMVMRRGRPPVDTTTYTLMATRRGKVAFARKDVITFWPEAGTVLAFDTHAGGPDSVAASDTLSADRWSRSLHLLSASSLSGRAIEVTHAGRTVLLPADSSPALEVRDLPMAGAWELRTAFLPDERLGDSTHPPPEALYVRVRFCGAGMSPS